MFGIFKKLNMNVPYPLSITLLDICLREMKAYFDTKIYIGLCIEISFVITKNWVKPKYPLIGKWLNKLGTFIPWSPQFSCSVVSDSL